jgi:hypothetical protein
MVDEAMPVGELPRREVIINFRPTDPTFTMHAAEYTACWQVEGQRITDTFHHVTNLPFAENEIMAMVGLGDEKGRSNSGHKLTEPMLLKYNSSDKIGNLAHELTHRFIMQHNIWRRNRDRIGATEVHQMLDLIYFEVLKELYGEPAALKRAEHEKKIDDPKYRAAWEWVLAKTPEERAALLKESVVIEPPTS